MKVRKAKKPLYLVYIVNKVTGELYKVIEYRDYKKAVEDNKFYNNTENLISEIKTILA